MSAERIDRDLQRKVARAELSRRALIVTMLLVAALVVGTQLVTILQVRKTQIEGTPTGQKLSASAERILDCTDPNGECYEKSQKRTADVIAALNLGALYGAYCVQQNPDATIPEVKACVKSLYDADSDAKPGDE